ncbi:hypothetical protein L484_016349 [Morus notabilis]|uniref:Uncharacterized protein n=1 Tax=Morus notabilis TaxID=981085 RepID=W9QE00_9ROSA|nr:hypothetical protein L484_016349 [Morus notabilis]
MTTLNLHLLDLSSRKPTAPPKNNKGKGAFCTCGSLKRVSESGADALKAKRKRTTKDPLANTSTPLVEVCHIPMRPTLKDHLLLLGAKVVDSNFLVLDVYDAQIDGALDFPPRFSLHFQALYETFFNKTWVAAANSPLIDLKVDERSKDMDRMESNLKALLDSAKLNTETAIKEKDQVKEAYEAEAKKVEELQQKIKELKAQVAKDKEKYLGEGRVEIPEPISRHRSGRGVAIGQDIVEKVQKDGKRSVLLDETGSWKAIGENAQYFDNAVGLHTRDICDPHYNAWKDVLEEHKRRIQNRMLDWFNLDYDHDNDIIRDVVNREANGGRKNHVDDTVCWGRSSTAANEEGIMSQVLGKRRGHTKGVGPTLPRRNRSSASTSSSASQLDGSSLVNFPQHVQNLLNNLYIK